MLLMRIPLFFMVGSWATFFSVGPAISPLAGYFGGVFGLSLYTIARLAWRFFFCSSVFGVSFLVHALPGWCATAYWVVPSVIGSVLLPLSALFLFVAHPVGAQAYVYALLWCIPVLIHCLRYTKFSFAHSFFAQALSATFAAHAVGSVLWLYFMPAMQAQTWILLTPVSLGERLFFAASMSAVRLLLLKAAAILSLPYISRISAKVAR
jgi:hypothetical protein